MCHNEGHFSQPNSCELDKTLETAIESFCGFAQTYVHDSKLQMSQSLRHKLSLMLRMLRITF